jgi:hypothetical protein
MQALGQERGRVQRRSGSGASDGCSCSSCSFFFVAQNEQNNIPAGDSSKIETHPRNAIKSIYDKDTGNPIDVHKKIAGNESIYRTDFSEHATVHEPAQKGLDTRKNIPTGKEGQKHSESVETGTNWMPAFEGVQTEIKTLGILI